MAKHKKRRKRKTKNSSRSQPSAPPAPKFTKWLFIFGVIACVAIAGFWGMKSFLRSNEKTQKKEPPPLLNERPEPTTAPLKLTPEQEITALKKEEIELTQQLMKEFPDSEVPLVLMGNAHRKHGNSAEAVKCWEKALAQNPRRSDVYDGMGWIAMNKGEKEKAIAFWRKALEINPEMPGVHNSIARAFIGLGKQKEAIKELEQDIQISPRSSFSFFFLGQVYLQQKEYEKAKESYEAAIEIEPELTNAYYGLATVCAKLGNKDMAREHREKFKKLKTEERRDLKGRKSAFDDLTEMRNGAAETYMFAGQMYQTRGRVQETEKLLKRAATLVPKNTICLMKLASLYQKSNRLSDALQMYKKISELEPENPICYLNIGIFSAKLKKFTDAEDAFRKVITLAPNNPNGYRELALLYLQIGQELRQAVQLAEKAVALEATAANYYVLSWARDKNGDIADALSAMKRAVELEPGNPKYQQMLRLITEKELIR
jgi:tetratricopeptide (TPR) repeat protein